MARERKPLAALSAVLAAALFIVLAASVVPLLLEPAPGLRDAVLHVLPETRVGNPVTAVLLDVRGYDTLLEVAVLVLAWLGATLAAGGGVPKALPACVPAPARALARVLVGPTLVLAGYMLWSGTDGAGGAFQSGALGAAAVIAWRLGSRSDDGAPTRLPGWVPLAGLGTFVVAAAAVTILSATFLDYPLAIVRETLLLIELATAFSVAAILAHLFDVVVGESSVS